MLADILGWSKIRRKPKVFKNMFLGGIYAADVYVHAKEAKRRIQVKSQLHRPKQKYNRSHKLFQVNTPTIYFKTYRI